MIFYSPEGIANSIQLLVIIYNCLRISIGTKEDMKKIN